jgi:hypothetical protein
MSQSLSLSTIQLRSLLEVFVSGTDRSVKFANEIEGQIALEFPEDHPVQELAEELAQYRPGGGDFLISESEMLPIVAKWLARIQGGKL